MADILYQHFYFQTLYTNESRIDYMNLFIGQFSTSGTDPLKNKNEPKTFPLGVFLFSAVLFYWETISIRYIDDSAHFFVLFLLHGLPPLFICSPFLISSGLTQNSFSIWRVFPLSALVRSID